MRTSIAANDLSPAIIWTSRVREWQKRAALPLSPEIPEGETFIDPNKRTISLTLEEMDDITHAFRFAARDILQCGLKLGALAAREAQHQHYDAQKDFRLFLAAPKVETVLDLW